MTSPVGRALTGIAVSALLLGGASGCTDDPPSVPPTTSAAPSTTPPTRTATPTATPPRTTPAVERGSDVATGLEVPWGIVALPGGRQILVAERISGRIDRITLATGERTTLGTVSGVSARGEGGLLGLALSPGFAQDRTLFVYLTTADDNRVVRMPVNGDRLGQATPIVTGIPSASIHNGGRIAFGPDRKLWITTGDAGDGSSAQDRSSLAGKILRAEADGGVPSDNPFDTLVWSYGHRNVQGIAWDSSGQPWATEFGANDRDELNKIVKGGNYGWPTVEGASNDDRFVAPAITWPTSESSPSGIAIVDDVAYVAALRGQRVWQVPLWNGQAGEPIARLDGNLGRVRTIIPAPDGSGLLVGTSNRDGRGDPRPGDDRIVRVTLG
jgi:glucose/arabinose dehydrogenase